MKSESFCDLVSYSSIPKERLGEIERCLSEASALVRRHQAASGSPNSLEFFAALMKGYREGSPVQVGDITVSAEDAAAMMAVKEVEGELLAGFSRMISKAVAHCRLNYGRHEDELHANAYEAFFSAMINYSGENRFSTYLWWALSRNLRRACLDRGQLKVPKNVRRIAMRVVDAMHKNGMTFDEAMESEGVPEKNRFKVVASMSRVCSATELDLKEAEMATSEDTESLDWVAKAVENAKLGRLESAVFKGFMEAPSHTMGLSEGCRGLVNPDTGRPYSRTAISCAWRQARKKIARAMGEVA